MVKVGVIGATGYAGAELVRILAGHPKATLSVITSRQYAGMPFDQVYPAMRGVVSLVCEEFSEKFSSGKLFMDDFCGRADIVFTALPHKISMEVVPQLVDRGKRVIDLSADFRFRNVKTYEAVYQPHTAPSLSEQSVYGLSEVYKEEISRASVVGNPGCYPTTVLLPLVPLLREGLIRSDGMVADAKSGVSGAGRSPGLGSMFCEVTESFKAYKVSAHRHNPEMDEVLGREADTAVHITFVPHLVPMSRGMLTTLYTQPAESATAADIRRCLERFYEDRRFVRICAENQLPATRHVRGTNFCDIGWVFDAHHSRLILVSAIDNLVKGAAGQAVQNMNIMLGFDESAGLDAVPYPL